MTDQKFTPGKWIVDEHGLSVWSKKRGQRLCDFLVLFQGNYGPWYEEQKANARLVAACPTMYKFIKTQAMAGCREAKELIESIEE